AEVGQPIVSASLSALVSGWRVDRFAHLASGPRPGGLQAGQSWPVAGGDVVSSAPELARLTMNVAMVHHDLAVAGGQRLVYGGHAIGLALTHASPALPALVTVGGWDRCGH